MFANDARADLRNNVFSMAVDVIPNVNDYNGLL
jgi:hypothetical protein